jgi:hypothetical protein
LWSCSTAGVTQRGGVVGPAAIPPHVHERWPGASRLASARNFLSVVDTRWRQWGSEGAQEVLTGQWAAIGSYQLEALVRVVVVWWCGDNSGEGPPDSDGGR